MAGTVYSRLKAFRYTDRLAAIAAGGAAPSPVHVRIKPTNVCNHSCWFCAYRSDSVSLGSGMVARDRIPREKMREIVDDLVEMGVEAVTFSGGGEPLIYPHIVETVERLAAGGVRIGALTNGSRLRGKVAEAFARHGTWLRVSIDGWDGPSYARSRRVGEDAFESMLGNLADFARRGSACALGASVIVDESNAPHLFELSRRLKEAGVGHVKLAPCIVRDSGRENDTYHARIADTVHAEIARIRGLEDGHFKVNDHYHALGDRFDRSERRCAMAYLLTIIGADLDVYTCQDKAYTPGGRLGSIRDRSFRDFWRSPETAAALAAIDPSVQCRHHCVSSSKNELLAEFLTLDPEHAAFV
ncbi:MAG: radical SAM protein [Reyranellaceae bacterium]